MARKLIMTEIDKATKPHVRAQLLRQRRKVDATLIGTHGILDFSNAPFESAPKPRRSFLSGNTDMAVRLRKIVTWISDDKVRTIKLGSKIIRTFLQQLNVAFKREFDEVTLVLTGVIKLFETLLVTGELVVSNVIQNVGLQPFEFALYVLSSVGD